MWVTQPQNHQGVFLRATHKGQIPILISSAPGMDSALGWVTEGSLTWCSEWCDDASGEGPQEISTPAPAPAIRPASGTSGPPVGNTVFIGQWRASEHLHYHLYLSDVWRKETASYKLVALPLSSRLTKHNVASFSCSSNHKNRKVNKSFCDLRAIQHFI